jgi:hypothetical protein
MKKPVLVHAIPFFLTALLLTASLASAAEGDRAFVPLFPKDGTPEGWTATEWNDLRKPAHPEAKWMVKEGVLHGSQQRGTWLISEKEYGDLELEYDFKLGETGNSGLALRAPMHGDPAFDGMELQMADYRYNTSAKDSELTGGIYRAIAPKKQVYKPTAWNKYEVRLVGNKLRVVLNGELIQDINLDDYTETVKRHDNTDAPPIKDRPRKGHLGFQELSRGDVHVMIRGAKIKVLD